MSTRAIQYLKQRRVSFDTVVYPHAHKGAEYAAEAYRRIAEENDRQAAGSPPSVLRLPLLSDYAPDLYPDHAVSLLRECATSSPGRKD